VLPQRPTAPAVTDGGDRLSLSTGALTVAVDQTTGALTWHTAGGDLLFREPHDGRDTKVLDDVEVLLTRFDGHARRVPMLPRWALGYLQSKERYTSQQELLDVVHEHRRRHIPLNCVVQDWKSWPGDLWGRRASTRTATPTRTRCARSCAPPASG
jgi:hypothetical protein